MLYPVYIHVGDEKTAHGMIFPDFPGCFSAADKWEDIPVMAQEAVECHMAGEGEPVPQATPLEQLVHHPDYRDGVWMLIDINTARIDPVPQRINVSMPRCLLAQIDQYTQAHHLTRSGFLARAAQEAMR